MVDELDDNTKAPLAIESVSSCLSFYFLLSFMVSHKQTTILSASAMSKVDPAILHESDLILHAANDPSVFDRSAASRRSAKRVQLRQITKSKPCLLVNV